MYFKNINKTQILMFSLGFVAFGYATFVFLRVSASYDIGIHTILSQQLVGRPTNFVQEGQHDPPESGDMIVKIGNLQKIETWAEVLEAPGHMHRDIRGHPTTPDGGRFDPATQNDRVRVKYPPADHPEVTREIWCELRQFPAEQMIPSVIWLFLKGSLFVIGALVYWKRPEDESALRFYIVCLITLGAYIGGYHWTRIVTDPVLLLVFMCCAVMLPVVNLHFYLVFPRKNRLLEQHPTRTLAIIYGIPLLNLLCLIGFYGYIKLLAGVDSAVRHYLVWVIYASFGMAAIWYLACLAALVHSLRTVEDAMERKQVKCILIGVIISFLPIGPSLYIVLAAPDKLAEGAATWPMFGASLIVTIAFAIGITRYRLMELDKIITSSIGYFLVSFLAGLMYYGVVFVGTLFYARFVSSPTLPAALTVSTTALIFVLALDAARSRFQRVLDRRLSRNKLQIDQTLRQMSQAISQLVDPPVLAKTLLGTVADTLGITPEPSICGKTSLRRSCWRRASARRRRPRNCPSMAR